jgi:hypothetical protein
MADPVAGAVLTELIAGAVASAAGRVWEKVRGTPEGRAVKAAIGAAVGEAVGEAVRLSALPPGSAVDDAWVARMDEALRPAFTAEVSQQLLEGLADPSGDAARGSPALRSMRWQTPGVTWASWDGRFGWRSSWPYCPAAYSRPSMTRRCGIRRCAGWWIMCSASGPKPGQDPTFSN